MCSKLSLVAVAVVVVFAVVWNAEAQSKSTVLDRMQEDTDLSEFFHLLQSNEAAKSTIEHRGVTVFAPTNRAFQKYAVTNGDVVLYHMSNTATATWDLQDSISSELDGNPPLWVTRVHVNRQEEIYINNAKILNGSNYRPMRTAGFEGKNQYLHRISQVLEPLQPNSRDRPVNNPNAFEFLNQSENLQLGKFRLRTFRERVVYEGKQHVFSADGRYTFFVPDEEGFKPSMRPVKIDKQVIDGHVIPNHVLFTDPTPDGMTYDTLAHNDNCRVQLSFVKDNRGKVYVKSNTLTGDAKHPTGVVLAEIVKPNIAVKNGVVHLIQRPLMVVDATVQQFLESFKEKEDGPVHKFYQNIRDYGGDFMEEITRVQDITLFAPSNAAWELLGDQGILQDKKRFRQILKLHYVREKLPLEEIKKKSVSAVLPKGRGLQVNAVRTAADRRDLFFNVADGFDGKKVVTVEGGGVNATILTANIAATNGIIHIIDRVLGVPYTTVLEKLKTDPMLNQTYILGKRRNFNDQLGDTSKRFTYFVPYDRAWEEAKVVTPTAYTKLFLANYDYHAKQVLERHLVSANSPWTMGALKNATSNGSIELKAQRDILKIRIREENGRYQIQWSGKQKWINVIRPDVACTNGIIHVIDDAFLLESDITVTDDRDAASLASLAPHLFMILIAKWLL
ncbi:fasciclin-1 isoform X2 [Fopius arisanus]|uniref:Fasciclin-1 isoform X2 n=1 Tax=Fopius arisanus TaxID=64838 RepID=A0A9R1TZ48_9HYME|nr:PREDICTED: fasciclin-1 isoform X2 [Fopius arisanus]